MSRLTDTDVLNIRAQLEDGVPRKDLALRYGVATETIAKIARRNTFVKIGASPIQDTHMDALAKASQAKVLQTLKQADKDGGKQISTTAKCEGALSAETLELLFGA